LLSVFIYGRSILIFIINVKSNGNNYHNLN